MEDHSLIKRCQQGDSDALRCIYDKYRAYLLILAAAVVGNAQDAEDVLHDVFLAFAKNIDHFRLTGGLKGYLSVCVANQARNHLKRGRYRKAVGLDQIEIASIHQQTPLAEAVCNEQLQRLSTVLSHLPVEQRLVIVLRVHANMRFRVIAKQLDLPLGTVKSRYRSGLMELRSLLKGQDKS